MEERKIYPEDLEDEDDYRPQNIVAGDEVGDEDQRMSSGEEYERCIAALQDDPHNVAAYQQMIENYKHLGKSELVQLLRVKAAEDAVPTLDMWKDWIESARAEATSFQERVKIGEVFEQALDCFSYFEVAKEYGEHMLELYADPENDGSVEEEEVKKVLEKILRCWLLDFSRSGKIWQLYLTFLSEVRVWPNTEEAKKQKEKAIRWLYKKKLLFPTMDLDSVWDEYKEWETDSSQIPEMQQRYNKASEKMPSMIKFEDNLSILFKEINTTAGNFPQQV